jgi:hypothetical protein
MSLDTAFKAFVGSVAGKHFAEPELHLTATVTEYAPPGIGTGAQVTVSVGGNDGVVLPYTLQDRVVVGDRLKVRTKSDQINRTYEVVSKDFSTDVAGQYIPGHLSPVVVVDGLANLPSANTPGGYSASASIRYQAIRRGAYDLVGQGWTRMRIRYRQTDPTLFIIDGANITSWIDQGSSLPHPSVTILTTLLAGITALSTSLLLAANLDIPPNPSGAAGGAIRLLVDNEIVSGDYTAATGVVSNLSRGVEPLAGDTTTNANSHALGAPVTVLSASIDIPTLATGTPYYVQIAPAREDGTIGIYVPNVPIAFTSWEQEQPPADVSGILMNQTKAALDARWHRVLADINGHPMHDLRGYDILRSPDPSTSPGWDAGTKTTPSTQLPASWSTLTDAPVDGKSAVPTNAVLWPIARGSGNWIGIRAVRNAGPVSVHWVWTLDNTPPPAPSGVSFTSVPNGILVSVDPVTDPAHGDPGFKEFVLYTNAAGSGTTGVEVTRSMDLDFTYQVYSLDSQTYYQLASADWAGNVSALATGGWRYVASLYPTNDWPQNGNLQDPDPTTPPPGTAGARPKHWPFFAASGSMTNPRYLATGGAEGNRVVAVDVAANAVANTQAQFQSDPQVIPSQKVPTFEVWVYSTQTLATFAMFGLVTGFANDDGSGTLGTYSFSSGNTPLAANTWTKITIVLTNINGHIAGTRVATLLFGPLYGPGTDAAATIYLDSVRIVFA